MSKSDFMDLGAVEAARKIRTMHLEYCAEAKVKLPPLNEDFLAKLIEDSTQVVLLREQNAELVAKLEAIQMKVARECAEIAWESATNWDAKAEILNRFGVSE